MNGYVKTNDGRYLLQLEDDNRWGFSLYDDANSWPGGSGTAQEWAPVPLDSVPAGVRESLDWILEQHSEDADDR